ncbi:unnamed protein product, partial [marine sediment metagenome]
MADEEEKKPEEGTPEEEPEKKESEEKDAAESGAEAPAASTALIDEAKDAADRLERANAKKEKLL